MKYNNCKMRTGIAYKDSSRLRKLMIGQTKIVIVSILKYSIAKYCLVDTVQSRD